MNKKKTSGNMQQALQQAVHLHKSGKFDDAERQYRSVLKQQPDNPDVLHFLGMLLYRRGDIASGLDSVRRATLVAPEYADAFNNLGNMLKLAGKYEDAEAAYRRTIALRPNDANSHNNLGLVLKVRQLFADAEAEFRKAIEIDDHHVPAYTNLGHLLKGTGRTEEAIGCFRAAIVFDPHNPHAPYVLGLAYQSNGNIAKAREVFQSWLEREPGNPIAKHMIQACSTQSAPARASDDYVRAVFDDVAESFDEHLSQLGYRAPQLIGDAFASAWPPHRVDMDVLDAGCGTGLCGASLRPKSRTLVGIDLSGGMLRRAQALYVYDELVEVELTAYLQKHPGAYDAIVSADTLCYFGALEAVFKAAASALRDGGRLFFTVEKAPDTAADTYHLQTHGRYNHAAAYVRRELEHAGFAVEAFQDADLRIESGKPVLGLVVTAVRSVSGQ